MKITYFLPLIFIGCSPQNYEDCVIQEVKEVTNNAAVVTIRDACKAKFPDEYIKENTINIKDVDLNFTLKNESIWSDSFKEGLKLEINKLYPNRESILLTNKSSNHINTITIGTTRSALCESDKNAYSQLIVCQSEIESDSTKQVFCKTQLPENQQLCIVSVSYFTLISPPETVKATPKPSIWQTIKGML